MQIRRDYEAINGSIEKRLSKMSAYRHEMAQAAQLFNANKVAAFRSLMYNLALGMPDLDILTKKELMDFRHCCVTSLRHYAKENVGNWAQWDKWCNKCNSLLERMDSRPNAGDPEDAFGQEPSQDFNMPENDRMYTERWGTYGANGTDKLKFVRLIDLSTDHLINILTTQDHAPKDLRILIRDILRQRKVV